MNILIIALLILAGILFFIIEVFLVPGITLAGIAAAICLLYANYYAFAYLGLTAGFLSLAASAAGCMAVVIWFMHSKTIDRLSLKKDINSKVNNQAEKDVKVGDTGIAITRLALIGNAEINGHIIEVKSMEGLIDERTPIIVIRITENIIMVKKLSHKNNP